MAENIDKTKKKKTLSLKLGTKPIIAPKRNIEAGKTVIVEKKRYKRSSSSETQPLKTDIKDAINIERKQKSINTKENDEKKSGVLLKPLSKDEQKRILKAESRKDKKDEIEKIRSGKSLNNLNRQNASLTADLNTKLDTTNNRDNKKDLDKKKNSEITNEIDLSRRKRRRSSATIE